MIKLIWFWITLTVGPVCWLCCFDHFKVTHLFQQCVYLLSPSTGAPLATSVARCRTSRPNIILVPSWKVTFYHADTLPQGCGSGLLPRRRARRATVAVCQWRLSWQGNGQLWGRVTARCTRAHTHTCTRTHTHMHTHAHTHTHTLSLSLLKAQHRQGVGGEHVCECVWQC